MKTLEQDHSNLSRGAVMMLCTFIGGFVLTYTFNVVLARAVTPHEYGNYKVAEAFINLGSLIAAMGGSRAAMRFLPEHMSSSGKEGVWEYTRFYLTIIVLVSISMMALVYIGHELHWSFVDGDAYHPLLLASAVVPLTAATALMGGVLQVAKRLELAFMPWRLGYPSMQLLLCLTYIFVVGSMTDYVAVSITLVSVLIVLSFMTLHIKRLSLMPLRRLTASPSPRRWLLVSMPMMFIIALQTLMRQVDIYMIEIMANETDVGHFAAALTTVAAVGTIQTALFGLLTPLVVPAAKAGPEAIRELNHKGFVLMMKGVIPVALTICIFGHQILQIFEHDTPLAYEALITLAIGYGFNSLMGLSTIWLQYSGKEKAVMMVLFASVLLNMVLNALLIPILNIEGAALATSIALIFSSTCLIIMLKRNLGIYPWTRCSKGNED